MGVDQVTRLEIAEAVGEVFGDGGATRGEILASAQETGAPDLVLALTNLPDRRYMRLNDLWEELVDIPLGV